MPDATSISQARPASAGVGHWLRQPWAFALIVVLGYATATLPILARHDFDPSAFIMAGDRFVDAAQAAPPIIVILHSNGYDGQFYYRLALSPFQMQPSAFGIRFDKQSYRMQRIFFPVLVWAATFGQAAAVPVAMYLVNLLGLAVIALFATRLTARLRLPTYTPVAILLWPGCIIALTHDTTEIITAALVLGALEAYFARRLLTYCLLAAAATLTRETTVLILGGIACYETIHAVRAPDGAARWRRALICGLALVPFLVWQAALRLIVGDSPQGGTHDLTWPVLGAAVMLHDTLTGVRHYAPGRSGLDALLRAYVLGSAGWLLGFCATVAARAPAVLRMASVGALAAGWLPILALMSMLAAGGPWVDRTAYFRAFTECYVVGCLVLGLRPVPRWLLWFLMAGGALAFFGAWGMAIAEK